MRDLRDALVWITGAGSGIGAAAAARLARAGCRVVLSGRRPGPLGAVADAILRSGGRASVEVLDISDGESALRTAARIASDHGAIDILVNSAGVNVPARRWREMSAPDWRAVIDVNLNGAFHCVQAVLPGMRAKKDGLIINISSWAGVHVSFLAGPAYTAAKHAMNAMTESLNIEEFVNGVRACAICPGEVATPLLDQRPEPVSAEMKARMLQPEDLGEAVMFVAAMPAHVCVNAIIVSPTWNRTYLSHHPGVAPA